MLQRLILTSWLVLFALCAHATPLWDDAVGLETRLDALSPAAVAAWAVAPRVEQVYLRPESLEIQLPGRAPVAAQRVHVFKRGARDLTWVGRLVGSEDQVMLTAREGWISGLIYSGGSVYELRPDADHGHVLLKLDQSQFPPCAGGVEPNQDFRRPETRPQPRGESDLSPRSSTVPDFDGTPQDTPVVIDVLVVYSAEARQNLGGTAQIQAHAQAAVDNGNLSFLNSEVEVVWNVVHMAEIPFTESGSCGERLGQLRTSAQANALRDEFQADMVGMLLANAGGACGCGYVMRNNALGPGFAPWAFQVTQNSCAVGNLTFAHEHGHNMGMEHDPVWGAPPSQASYPWSFGHFVSGEFRTVMSYANECVGACPRQPHFSNPEVNVQGSPTGIADQRDNARTARLTAPIIAEFRGPPPPIEALSNGVPVTDLAGAQGSERFFSIEIPAGATDLEISISGGTGDADLYVRFDSLPSLGLYDCRPFLVGNNESCSFPAPEEGTYFVMLHGFNAYAGVTLVASFTPPLSEFDLNVQSSGAANVPITSPTAGLGGITDYTRSVAADTEVELTAPATSGTANFSNWSDCDSVGGDGDRTCTLTIDQDRTVTANFVAQTRIIRLTGNLNFGEVSIGSTETRNFRIHNDGNDPLEVSGISFPAGVFTGNWDGGTIGPDSSRLVTVTFAPAAAQTYAGEVIVDSNATSGTNTRAISGTGQDEMIFHDQFEADGDD